MSKTKEVTIKHSNEKLAGQKVNLPNEGTVRLTKDCTVEVSEETADLIVQEGSNWSLAIEKPSEAKVVADEPKEVGEALKTSEKAIEEDTKEQSPAERLSEKLSLKELKEVAITAKLGKVKSINKMKVNVLSRLIVKSLPKEDLVELLGDN
ncbi:MAG: hypothetical protein ACTSQA_04275 [Candidatus Heimdallarchaeaceae archaeon]